MSDLLDQINDEEEEPRVTLTDTDGVTGTYEFLDLVFLGDKEYAVLSPDGSDGDVVIFYVRQTDHGEEYVPVADETLQWRVFEVFQIQHEDEFDFS